MAIGVPHVLRNCINAISAGLSDACLIVKDEAPSLLQHQAGTILFHLFTMPNCLSLSGSALCLIAA